MGSLAPEFELETDAGTKISLASLRGKPVLLYFYPKDDTPGCTVEACAFRDELAALSAAGAVVLGVSRDSVTSHAKFKAKHSLNFPLLSDPTARTIADYGSWGQKAFMGKKFLGIVRTSVLIDADGKVAKVYPKVKPAEHAKEVLADLAAIKR
ncbi:MAG: thioredoxin-dependent thiol peroxidase [Deltaproteobacteria bacterium]|nr:thioredoxin-dependent thiol peroxidase [Deltaproteobacteria bacterium]